jgi:hypothetical protein
LDKEQTNRVNGTEVASAMFRWACGDVLDTHSRTFPRSPLAGRLQFFAVYFAFFRKISRQDARYVSSLSQINEKGGIYLTPPSTAARQPRAANCSIAWLSRQCRFIRPRLQAWSNRNLLRLVA